MPSQGLDAEFCDFGFWGMWGNRRCIQGDDKLGTKYGKGLDLGSTRLEEGLELEPQIQYGVVILLDKNHEPKVGIAHNQEIVSQCAARAKLQP